MAKYTNLTSLFTAIAEAIRAKKGTTGKIVADNFPEEIAGIETGETIETVDQAIPDIDVSSSGLITATAKQTAGYVNAGETSAKEQLNTQGLTYITPGTDDKIAISAGKYTTGPVYVYGDADLVKSNIKSGVDIFGVVGTYEGETSGSGYIGDEVEKTRDSGTTITFSCDTTNLIGYVVLAEYVTDVDQIAAIFYNSDTFRVFVTAETSTTLGEMYNTTLAISHTINSDSVVITANKSYGAFVSGNDSSYYFFPIYSN